jgi:hypothetical protein
MSGYDTVSGEFVPSIKYGEWNMANLLEFFANRVEGNGDYIYCAVYRNGVKICDNNGHLIMYNRVIQSMIPMYEIIEAFDGKGLSEIDIMIYYKTYHSDDVSMNFCTKNIIIDTRDYAESDCITLLFPIEPLFETKLIKII